MSKTKLGLSILSFIVLTAVSSTSMAVDRTLSVPIRYQEHSMWCWDGSSQMILYFRGKYPTQCSIANWAFRRSDCCASSTFYWNHSCNSGNWVTTSNGVLGILRAWGVGATAAGYLARTTVVSDINYNRPFAMEYRWTGGGGHVLVGRGYRTDGYYIQYNDPWPGEGMATVLHSWAVSASDHYWATSVRTY